MTVMPLIMSFLWSVGEAMKAKVATGLSATAGVNFGVNLDTFVLLSDPLDWIVATGQQLEITLLRRSIIGTLAMKAVTIAKRAKLWCEGAIFNRAPRVVANVFKVSVFH